MTAVTPVLSTQRSLPPLGGGLLWLYRSLWVALAGVAVLVHALLLTETSMHPAILALRLVKAVVIFAVVTILFRKRQRDPVAALLSLAFLCWTITSSFDFSSRDVLPQALDRIRFLLFVLGLLLFPDGEWRPVWARQVAIASVGVTAIGLLEALGVVSTRLFLPLAIGCVLAALAALLQCFRTAASEAQRQQMKWVTLGLVSGIFLILTARAAAALSVRAPGLVLPAIWEGLFQAGIVIVAAGFLIALLRYRLFDAETAISRSAAFAVLTIAIVAIFAATEAAIENVGQNYLGMGLGNVSAAAGAAVAAVLLNPLHERISGWAERRFQRDLIVLKSELPALLDDVAQLLSPEELAAAALPRICEAIHATRAALLVDGSLVAVEGVDSLVRAVEGSRNSLFPVRMELNCPFGRLSASLLLGPRPDGSFHGKDDLQAVEAIIPALRRALLTTIGRDTFRSEYRQARTKLAGQVSALRQRIHALESRQRLADLARS